MQFSFTSSASNFNCVDAGKEIRRQITPLRRPLYVTGFTLTFLSYAVALADEDDRIFGFHLGIPLLLGFAMLITGTVMGLRLVRSMRKSMRASESQTSDWTYSISEVEFSRHREGHRETITWHHFCDVKITKKGLILFLSKGEFIPVPTINLPTAISPNDLYSQISEWINFES